MKKILISIFTFIMPFMVLANSTNSPVVSRNIAPTRPQMITESLQSVGTLNLNSKSLGKFKDIPSDTELFLPGQDTSKLAEIIQANYTFSTTLKNKLNEVINDLYSESSSGTGRISSLYYSDVAIWNSLTTAVSNINHAVAANDADIRNLDGRVDTLESKLLITGYDTSINYNNVSQTDGYIPISFSYMLTHSDKVISGYIDKSIKPNIAGYYLMLDVNYNDPRIIPGKVYRLLLTGNDKLRLVVRNLSVSGSYPRVFVCGGTVTEANFEPWVDKTAQKSYSQYASLGAYRDYLIEIHVSGNHMYVTINQGNRSLAAPTDRIVNQQITGNYTCTYMYDKTTSNEASAFTPRLDGTGSGSYVPVVNAGDGINFAPIVALTVKLKKANHIPYDRLKATMTFRTYAGDSYSDNQGPRIYVYNSDDTAAQIQGGSYIQFGAADKADQDTQTKTITFKYSGQDAECYLYKVLIDAEAYGANHSFSMKIDDNPTNIIGNPQ